MSAIKLNTLFNSIINLNELNRSPIVFETDDNDLNVFQAIDNELNVNHASFLSLKVVKNSINKINDGNKFVHRSFLGSSLTDAILSNKTVATQFFMLYLNQALIELTKFLGSNFVTSKKNNLDVVFIDRPEINSVEMRIGITA